MTIPNKMKAMVFKKAGEPLELMHLPVPTPNDNQVLIKIHACGVCRTDLHIVDGELTEPKKNLIPGHEIVGTVMKTGKNVKDFKVGDKIGVPWLGYSCGKCAFCKKGKENLCDNPGFTGYTIDGGYAEYTVADQRYCFNIPDGYDNYKAAPLLCAGLIGYRSYRMCGSDFETLGIYGFGGAAHIITQIAVYQGKKVYAFTRPGDKQAQDFSFRLGAVWAGDSTEPPPELLDAAIIFAPVGSLVPAAMKAVVKGGVIVCGGIYMSNIPEFPYSLLWEERQLISVANLTRQDGDELMAIAPKVPVETEVTLFPLEQANEALERLRSGNIEGAAVLKME